MTSPIVIGPVLNRVSFAVTGPETRLTLEMTLPQAEAVLARLTLVVSLARAWRPASGVADLL